MIVSVLKRVLISLLELCLTVFNYVAYLLAAMMKPRKITTNVSAYPVTKVSTRPNT